MILSSSAASMVFIIGLFFVYCAAIYEVLSVFFSRR